MKMGQNIKHLRKQQKLTRQQVADAVGVTVQTVGLWEMNITSPHTKTLPNIAATLGVSIDMLFNYEIKPVALKRHALADFVADYCEAGDGFFVSRSEIYNSYCLNCQGRPFHINHFARLLREYLPDIQDLRTAKYGQRTRYYTGIGLK